MKALKIVKMMKIISIILIIVTTIFLKKKIMQIIIKTIILGMI